MALLLVIAACWLPLYATTQDTLKLRGLPGAFAIKGSLTDFSVFKTAPLTYSYLASRRYTADTAGINARYLPSLNPQLAWRHAYPLTPQQMEERDRQRQQENDIRGQIMADVVRSIFSRKKPTAVKPTF